MIKQMPYFKDLNTLTIFFTKSLMPKELQDGTAVAVDDVETACAMNDDRIKAAGYVDLIYADHAQTNPIILKKDIDAYLEKKFNIKKIKGALTNISLPAIKTEKSKATSFEPEYKLVRSGEKPTHVFKSPNLR